jgi:tape measure domain-containing protein
MTGVNIKIRADARQATGEMRKLSTSLGSIEKQAKSITSTFQKLAIGLTAAFASSRAVKGIVKATDDMTNMGNRVKLVTKDLTQTKIVMNELFEISKRSRASVGTATDTFSRFGLALKGSNKSAKELLLVTETVQQAAALSGAGAETAKNAIVQLGQGLSSGELRGEELNSVLEGIPRLAEAIADGMGIPFGELRAAAKDGLLTAEGVFEAIKSGAIKIDKEFSTLEATTSGLAEVFKNEFKRALFEMDKILGLSDAIRAGLIIATEVVTGFGKNIGTWALIASTQFLLLETKIKFFAHDTKKVLSDLFTGGLDGQELADNVLEALDKLKGKVQDKLKQIKLVVKQFFRSAPEYDGFDNVAEVTPIDVSKGFITGFNSAVAAVTSFTTTIADLFKGLWKAVLANSWWTGIFDKNHEEEGVAAIGNTGAWGKFLDAATGRILSWTNAITGLFSNLHGSVTGWWNTIVDYIGGLNLKETRLKGLEKGFDLSIANLKLSWSNFTDTLMAKEIETPAGLKTVETKFGVIIQRMKASWDDFYKYLTVKTVDTPQGQEQVDTRLAAALNKLPAVWDTTVNTMSTRWDEFYKYLTVKTVDTPDGLKTVETNFAAILGRMKKELSNFSTKFDGAFSLTKEVKTPGGTATVDSDLVAGVKESLKNAREAVQGVPIFVALKLLVSNLPESLGRVRDGIIEFFDGNKNIISAAITSALALALSSGLRKMVLKGGIVGAFLLAAATLGNNAEFLGAANKTAAGFGEALKKAFSGGSGEGTMAGDILSGLGNLASAIGTGLVDGIFGEDFDSKFVDNFVTGIVVAVAAVLIAPRTSIAMIRLGLSMARSIVGPTFVGALASGFTDAFGKAGKKDAAKRNKAMIGRGRKAGDAIKKGLLGAGIGLYIGSEINDAFEVDQTSWEGIAVLITSSLAGGFAQASLIPAIISLVKRGFAGAMASNAVLLAANSMGAFIAAATSTAVALAPFAAIGALIVAIILAGMAVEKWDLDKVIGDVAGEMAAKVTRYFGGSEPAAKNAALATEGFMELMLAPLKTIGKLAKVIFDKEYSISDAFTEANAEIGASSKKISDAILDQLGLWFPKTKKFIEDIPVLFENIKVKVTEAATAVSDAIKAPFVTLFDWMEEKFNKVSGFVKGIGEYFGDNKAPEGPHPLFRATGGPINGPGTGTSDDIPAMLSNGEYVMQASAVQKFGPDFMRKVNAGIMPQMFNKGGLAGQIDQVIAARTVALSRGDDIGYQQATKLTEQLKRLTDATNAQLAILDSGTDKGKAEVTKELKTGKKNKDRKTAAEIGEDYAASFENDFNAGLKQAFRDGDVKGFLTGILDSFTGNVIDSFVDGLTNSLFEGLSGKGGILSGFFENIVGLGGDITSKAGDAIVKGAKGGEASDGLSGIFGGLTDMFSSLMSSLGDSLSGLMSGLGGGGGGGGLFSSIFGMTFGSIFGFSQGGIVPNTSTSQTGKDSVPAMLMPGEVVLSKNDVSRMGNNSESSTQQFNINVSGDVSRQTRKEIVKMIPQITSGVNMTNREKGAR